MADWGYFCEMLAKDLEIANKWISNKVYTKDGFSIVRIDLFKDKPFHVTTSVLNRDDLCNGNVSWELSNSLRPLIKRAIEENLPITFIPRIGF